MEPSPLPELFDITDTCGAFFAERLPSKEQEAICWLIEHNNNRNKLKKKKNRKGPWAKLGRHWGLDTDHKGHSCRPFSAGSPERAFDVILLENDRNYAKEGSRIPLNERRN